MTDDRASAGEVGGRTTGDRKVRTFVAVPLPAEIQAAMHLAARDLSAQIPEVIWSRKAENLHITLRFLGQVDQTLLGQFVSALAEAMGSRDGFEIGLRGLGAFPSARDARVIWVGVEDPACRLADVAAVVESVADRFALGPVEEGGQARAFRGHVTVGRTSRRTRRGVDAVAALEPWSDRMFGSVAVREIHLYESITGGDASTYVLRGKAVLQPC